MYVVDVLGAEASDFNPYIKKVKEAGFTIEADSDEYDGLKFFTAQSSDGYEIIVQYAGGVFTIGVVKE